jgi:hypothetical protein
MGHKSLDSSCTLWGLPGPLALRRTRRFDRGTFEVIADRTCWLPSIRTLCYNAVVKVPPPVGCVKYKAQHVVLPMQILLFLACYKPTPSKLPRNSCGFPLEAATNAGLDFTATTIPGPGSQSAHTNRSRDAQFQPFPHPLRLGFPPPNRKAQNQCIPCGETWESGKQVTIRLSDYRGALPD